ncbi:MAG TPA: Ig-like domain-containing protein [Gaiellaceae bacterium]|nr:Ig-like domain-containing protein [Gaiellaceae bacterium]
MTKPLARLLPHAVVCLTSAALLVACNGDDPVAPESRVRSIALPGGALRDTLVTADTVTLHPVLRDASGQVVSGARIVWSSSSSAATVDSTGKVTARALGTATIGFASGQARDSVVFTVVSLALRDGASAMMVGDTVRLNPVLATGSEEVAAPVQWTSTDTMTLRVDATGLVTGTGFGSAAVIATWTGPHGTAADTQAVTVSFYQVPLPVSLVSVTVGAAQACGLTAAGESWCWGSNLIPGVGTRFGDARWHTDPTLVSTGARFTRLDAGVGGTCGWTAAGEIFCWGRNDYQALAPDTNVSWIAEPRQVRTTLAFPNGGLHSPRGQTCGIDAGGTAYCWAYNAFGTLGHATVAPSTDSRIDTSFTAVDGGHQFRNVDSDGYSMCGADVTGAAWCWGSSASTISDVPAGEHIGRVRGSVAFTSVAVSFSGAVCGTTAAGDGYCWGMNDIGQLGVGTTDTDVHLDPTPIAGGHRWKRIVAGVGFCGITTENKLYCWGPEQLGYRGLDPTRPEPVAPSLDFRSVDLSFWTSNSPLVDFACGVTTTGATYCFTGGAP